MKTRGGDDSPRYVALLQLLRTADAVWNASRIFFARWDLSPSQFNVLNLLRFHPAGQSQTELSRQLIMHRSNVTGLVDRLERRGLVHRQEVAGDRRSYRVTLSAQGAALLRGILPAYYAAAERVWEELPASRLSALTDDLLQAAQEAERISEEVAKR